MIVDRGVGGQVEPPPRSTYLVKQLQEALLARLDRITRSLGLTTRQYTTLSVLAKYPGISSAQLARLTFVSPQAANEMVVTLERKGLITRAVDPDNRRRLEVRLTRSGRSALSRCDARVDELEAEVFSGVAPAERARFQRLLQTFVRTLDRGPGPPESPAWRPDPDHSASSTHSRS